MRKHKIFAARIDRSEEQPENELLVSYGGSTDKWGKYPDGAIPEGVFTINKWLMAHLGNPDSIFVAFSDQDFLTKTLPADVDVEKIAKQISEAAGEDSHYFAVFPDLGIELFVGKTGWIKDLKEKAGV